MPRYRHGPKALIDRRPELGKQRITRLRALGEVAVSLPGGDQRDELRGEVVAADTSVRKPRRPEPLGPGPGQRGRPADGHLTAGSVAPHPAVISAGSSRASRSPAEELDAILRSHDIDPLALRADDFPAFFTARFERLLKQIEEATGKPVNRSAEGDNPFAAAAANAERARSSRRSGGSPRRRSKAVKKSTGRKNLETGEKDPAMEYAVRQVRSPGCMNTEGGTSAGRRRRRRRGRGHRGGLRVPRARRTPTGGSCG